MNSPFARYLEPDSSASEQDPYLQAQNSAFNPGSSSSSNTYGTSHSYSYANPRDFNFNPAAAEPQNLSYFEQSWNGSLDSANDKFNTGFLKPMQQNAFFNNASLKEPTNPIKPIPSISHGPLQIHPHSLPTSQPSLSLPSYSSSGFDVLSLLSFLPHRPNPTVYMGPIDLSTSFVITSPSMPDNPVVYCSPSFGSLTGYSSEDIIGKNCRFLQSPPTGLSTASELVSDIGAEGPRLIRQSLDDDKEVQVKLVNYKKNGNAFVNFLTIIPVTIPILAGNPSRAGFSGGPIGSMYDGSEEQTGTATTMTYHIGFQVDLGIQQENILKNVASGMYNYDHHSMPRPSAVANKDVPKVGPVEKKPPAFPVDAISDDLKTLLRNPAFLPSFSTSTAAAGDNHPLAMVLLSGLPDFVHVVSLKGTFLYVAPGITRLLGYEPDELLGKGIYDICHPADVVPILRMLKESSNTGPSIPDPGGSSTWADSEALFKSNKAPTLSLLYRARIKSQPSRYVWVEACGRLHVEPGKGRKAIILSGRVKEMDHLPISTPMSALSAPPAEQELETEFFGRIHATGTILHLAAGTLLGWSNDALVGKSLYSICSDEDSSRGVMGAMAASAEGNTEVKVRLKQNPARSSVHLGSNIVTVQLRVFSTSSSIETPTDEPQLYITPGALVFRITLLLGESPPSFGTPLRCPVSIIPNSDAQREDMFSVLNAAQNTSWQYEIQQLKFENDRLEGEIRELMSSAPPSPDQSPSVVSMGKRSSVASDTGYGMGFGGQQPDQSSGPPRLQLQMQSPTTQVQHPHSPLFQRPQHQQSPLLQHHQAAQQHSMSRPSNMSMSGYQPFSSSPMVPSYMQAQHMRGVQQGMSSPLNSNPMKRPWDYGA